MTERSAPTPASPPSPTPTLDALPQPNENELAGARYQVRAIAETAAKLHG